MRNTIIRYVDYVASAFVTLSVFLFWYLRYPQALSFHEQYQLFLWTWDYFVSDVTHVGGVADYLSEFVVQFYRLEWVGAAMAAAMTGVLYLTIVKVLRLRHGRHGLACCLMSLCVVALLIWHQGDENVLFSYVMSMLLTSASYLLLRRLPAWADLLVVPCVYWLAGPMVWLYTGLRCVDGKRLHMPLLCVLTLTVQLLSARYVLTQWDMESVMYGTTYYRGPRVYPVLQFVIPSVVVLVYAASALLRRLDDRYLSLAMSLTAAALAVCADYYGYDKDKYELIRQDYLIRNERWSEVIARADRYQVNTSFSSVCVNLSLSMTGQLTNRMFSYYQSGKDALVMPMYRDFMSDIPTMEVFYRLGMVNECMRYAFDLQESILDGKISGRLTQRVAECCIVNGKYKVARKYLDILEKSLFYAAWAKEARTYLGREQWIDAHPVWGKMRKRRYKEDFLYSYGEIDKMFAILFKNDTDNRMALEYFMAQLLLNGDAKAFKYYLPLTRQYGGYTVMPYVYQDAARCMGREQDMKASPYGRYVIRMMNSNSQADNAR